MRRDLRFLILGSFLALAACKKGVPDIQNLRKLSGFSLDQNLIAVSSKTSPQFTITGKCSDSFTDIEISLDDGNTWASAQTLASPASINCSSSGTFSLTFVSTVSSFIRSGSAAADGNWRFRATSELGSSDDLSLSLFVPQKGHLVLIGSNRTVSGGMTLTSRVGGTLSTSASGGYTLKGTIKPR